MGVHSVGVYSFLGMLREGTLGGDTLSGWANKIALSYIEETQKMEIITAKDSFSENCPINEKTKLGILRALEVKDPKDTGQLCYQLKVSKCCRVAITTNINVKDGLVNGAMGTIRDFTKTERGEIHIIWVEFDNNNVGNNCKVDVHVSIEHEHRKRHL